MNVEFEQQNFPTFQKMKNCQQMKKMILLHLKEQKNYYYLKMMNYFYYFAKKVMKHFQNSSKVKPSPVHHFPFPSTPIPGSSVPKFHVSRCKKSFSRPPRRRSTRESANLSAQFQIRKTDPGFCRDRTRGKSFVAFR